MLYFACGLNCDTVRASGVCCAFCRLSSFIHGYLIRRRSHSVVPDDLQCSLHCSYKFTSLVFTPCQQYQSSLSLLVTCLSLRQRAVHDLEEMSQQIEPLLSVCVSVWKVMLLAARWAPLWTLAEATTVSQ